MGEALVELSPDQLAGMAIPEKLRDAVLAAKTMNSHGARRRQLQFIGSLMRTIDPEPVKEALDRLSQGRAMARDAFRKVESFRDELVRDDGALDAFAAGHPGVDRRKLRQLVLGARREAAGGKSGTASRNLFRLVRDLLEDEAS
jgi:ribosome-associated protein